MTLQAFNDWRVRPRPEAPGEPVWSPDGKMFLYRQGRQLMVYDVAGTRAHDVLGLDALDAAAIPAPRRERFDWENRRVDEQTFQWAPSGREVLYLGNGDLFWINLQATRNEAKWRQLTKTPAQERDPKLSPDGKQAAFLRDWDLYTLDIASGKETRITTGGTDTLRNGAPDWVYPEELDLGSAYWWSPDSRNLAYLQFDTSGEPLYPHSDLRGSRAVYEPQRYPQAGDNNASVRLGIVSADGASPTTSPTKWLNTKWIDLGDTVHDYLIPRAGWVPDGKQIYVVRTNRVQNDLEFLLFDKDSGRRRTVYQEKDPYWINIVGSPRFLKNGTEFLWTVDNEEEGGQWIYRYPLDGSAAKQLVPGNSIVCANEDSVYFMSSTLGAALSPLERRLYRAKIGATPDSAEQEITREAGTHRISMAPGCGHFLDTYSSLTSPPETTLHSADGKESAIFRPADRKVIEDFDLRPTEIVTFQGAESERLYGRLIRPAGFDPRKKYPVIVQVYGGPHAQSVRNVWSGVTMDQVFAHNGFVVWEVDNRGTTGRGHRFEMQVNRNLGAAELADQVAGIKYLISLGFVDPTRIGVNGWSYGGFMTLNMLLNVPDVFHAGFAGAPVTNWLNYDTIYTERYMGLPQDNREAYARTALPAKADKLQGRLMIAHNLEDDNVLFQNTVQMIEALEQAGKQFELSLYTQKTHGVGGVESRQLNATMLDFFVRSLVPETSKSK